MNELEDEMLLIKDYNDDLNKDYLNNHMFHLEKKQNNHRMILFLKKKEN